MSKNCIQYFALLEVNKSSFTDEEYRVAEEAGLFVVNGCSRKVIAGHIDDIRMIEPYISTQHTRMESAEAYAHMLQFITGQFSKTRGESQIVSQFRDAWQKFASAHSDKASSMDYLYSSLIDDNGLLRGGPTAGLLPAFYETTAHKLSNQTEGGEQVLVIASPNAKGNGPSKVAYNLIKQLGNNRAKRAGDIIITHPDPNILDAIMHELRGKSLTVKPRAVPFEQAIAMDADDKSSLAWTRVVYNTLAMDQNPEVDRKILEACREHEIFNGQLVHLGGPTKPDRVTRGVWTNHNLDNAIMPETITAQQQKDQAFNADIINGPGRIAAENCAMSRMAERNPQGRIITQPPEEYLHNSGIAKSGAFRAAG